MRTLLVGMALVATACQNDQMTPHPLEAGTHVHGTGTETSETVMYKFIDGTAVEQKGTIGFGGSCATARASSGTYREAFTGTTETDIQVIGNTVNNHPVVPGIDVYGKVGISVLARQDSSSGSTVTTEVFNQPEESQESYQEVTQAPGSFQSFSYFYGMAVDEFYVELYDLGLFWDGTVLECTDPDCSDNPGVPNQGTNEVALITMNNPSKGDVWMDYSGDMIYRFDGTEKLNVGGKSVTADRVQVYVNGEFDAVAAEAASECVVQSPESFETTQDDVDSFGGTRASLRFGCENSYMYQQEGTLWFYQGVLVKAERDVVELDIVDYGFESYEEAEDGESCVRNTSTLQTEDSETFFVQYSVTVSTESYAADVWEMVDLSNGGE